tara:strand:- start:52 stop:447 length:396 start_codon:yes stop_codon:yes gene_type:complete
MSLKDLIHKRKEAHPAYQTKLNLGQRYADWLTKIAGSWSFILGVLILIGIWSWLNVTSFDWDPYPFILLNFVLSCLAALQAPIILMSANREAERDRLNAKYDYHVNRKAEREIQDIQKDLEEIKKLIRKRV